MEATTGFGPVIRGLLQALGQLYHAPTRRDLALSLEGCRSANWATPAAPRTKVYQSFGDGRRQRLDANAGDSRSDALSPPTERPCSRRRAGHALGPWCRDFVHL